MPSTPDAHIQQWFKELLQFQAACINNDAGKLSPLDFANATIITYLKSPASQNNFLVNVADTTGFDDLQISDLSTYKTFGALLNYSHLLENEIFNSLQGLSDPAVQNIDSVAYYATPVATALAGGSTGPAWVAALGVLMASMDSTCFTLVFRLKVNATVDKAGAAMKDLIQQIAGLG